MYRVPGYWGFHENYYPVTWLRKAKAFNNICILYLFVDNALVSMSANNFAEALLTLEQADKMNPGNPLIINNKSVCLLYLGRLKEALAVLESELTSDPRNFLRETHVLNLATLYELESSYAGQKKQALLDTMSQFAGDGVNISCLKF